MVTALAHRGPDAEGLRSFAGCAFGMRRLRVVDLRPEADQPMTGESGDIWLVYNGELYNHVELRRELITLGHTFRSRSDTEVIVHGYEQWGEGVVGRLRGMFAFAIWEERARRLLLARDRLGIKPLYLLDEPGGGLSFASEVRAFGRRELDPVAVATYLRMGWTGTRAISAGVREMAPGTFLVVDDAGRRSTTYWQPTWRDDALDLDALGSALRNSVSRHLEADVPVGIFLSSGLDSAVIGSLAAATDHDVTAYTVGYDVGGDEIPEARARAQDLGLKHESVLVSGADVVAQAPSIVGNMDQPTVDGVNSWIISRAVRNAGMTVALSGLGGDELFSGYSTFRKAPRLAALSRLPIRQMARGASAVLSESSRLRDSRSHRALEGVAMGGLHNAYGAVRAIFPMSSVARLWPAGAHLLEPAAADPDLLMSAGGDQTVGRLELANYLRYQLLRDTDAMSMAHSLEVRVPLLDDRVVEAALATGPANTGQVGKSALAVAAGLPASLATQPKMTFTLPFDRWLHTDLRSWAMESLDILGRSSLGFDHKAVTGCYDEFEAGRLGWRSLWALVSLGGWIGAHEA